MRTKKTIYTISLILTLFFSINISDLFAAKNKIPSWVKQRPVDFENYIGIGTAIISNNNGHIVAAKQAALLDIASEISVNISGSQSLNTLENNQKIQEEFKSHTQATTQNSIENYELVDSYSDGKYYWVYYRLNKIKYQTEKKQKFDAALFAAKNYFENALAEKNNKNLNASIASFINSLESIKSYLNEDLTFMSLTANKKINLLSDIKFELNDLFQKIQINHTKTNKKYEGQVGKSLKEPIELNLNAAEFNTNALPFKLSFVTGKGQFLNENILSEEKKVIFQISKIESKKAQQNVQIEFDLNYYFTKNNPKESSFLIDFLDLNKNLPRFFINIHVSSLTVFLELKNENNFADSLYLKNTYKGFLANEIGFSFVNQAEDAQLYLILEASITPGSTTNAGSQEIFRAYLNLNILITSKDQKQELLNESLSNIRGIQNRSFSLAVQNAIDNSLVEIKEICKIYCKTWN